MFCTSISEQLFLLAQNHKDCYTRKEGNVLFNDALNTFYLQLYGVRHMVKDHSDSEIGNPLPPHGLLFPISSKGSFIYNASSHRQDDTYHSLWYTSRGALAGTRNIIKEIIDKFWKNLDMSIKCIYVCVRICMCIKWHKSPMCHWIDPSWWTH